MEGNCLASLVGLAVAFWNGWAEEPKDDSPPIQKKIVWRDDDKAVLEFDRMEIAFEDGPDGRPRDPGFRWLRREGDSWIVSGVDIVIPAEGGEGEKEKPPIDLSKGPVKIKLEDGREAELRPVARRPFERRFRAQPGGPPPGDAPMPPEPPGPPALAPPGPRLFDEEAFRRLGPEEEELIDKQRDIERQCGRLAMRYRHANNDEDKAKIREELTESLTKLFDARQEMREKSLGRMKSELERLEKSIQERQEKKSSLIEQRLRQLIEDPVDF